MSDEEKELTLREELEQQLNAEEPAEEEETVEETTEEPEAEEEDETNNDDAPEGSDDSAEDPEVDEEEPEEVDLNAPEHWADEDKETFGKQNDDVKAYMLKRHKEMESGFTKKTQDLAEQRKSVDGLSQFLSKWEPHTSALGVPLVTGLEAMLNTDRNLRSGTAEQKTQLLLQLAQQYGINLNTTPQVEDEYADPQLKQMQDQINMLKGNETTRQQQTEQAVTQRQQSIQQEVQTASDTFKAETDDKGTLKFPHFDTLKADMAVLVQSGQAGTGSTRDQLESAYSKALWMNPDTRVQLQKEMQSSQKAEDIKKQSKAAAQAKKSAKANKKGTTTKAEKPKGLPSLRDDLAEQIKQAEASA